MKRELGKGQRIELKRCAKVSVDGKEGCPVRITQYIIQHVAHPSVHCQAMHNADATSPILPIIAASHPSSPLRWPHHSKTPSSLSFSLPSNDATALNAVDLLLLHHINHHHCASCTISRRHPPPPSQLRYTTRFHPALPSDDDATSTRRLVNQPLTTPLLDAIRIHPAAINLRQRHYSTLPDFIRLRDRPSTMTTPLLNKPCRKQPPPCLRRVFSSTRSKTTSSKN